MEIYVKVSLISMFSPFSCFQSRFCHVHRFYPYRSFNTSTDDVT